MNGKKRKSLTMAAEAKWKKNKFFFIWMNPRIAVKYLFVIYDDDDDDDGEEKIGILFLSIDPWKFHFIFFLISTYGTHMT